MCRAQHLLKTNIKWTTWWLIPLSKWVITPVISGLTLLSICHCHILLKFHGVISSMEALWRDLIIQMCPHIFFPVPFGNVSHSAGWKAVGSSSSIYFFYLISSYVEAVDRGVA
jgi:hypothetical protein